MDNGSCSDGFLAFGCGLASRSFMASFVYVSVIIFSLSLSLSQLVKGERVRAILSYNQDYELKLFTNSSKVCY